MKSLKLLIFAVMGLLYSPLYAEENPKRYYTDIPGVQANVLIKTSQSWNGTALPAYGDGPAEITIVRYTFAPGAAIPMHMHPVINAGVLLSGQLSITTKSGQNKIVKAGEPLVELFKEWHYGANIGAEPVDLIVVYAGTVGSVLTIRE
jgi:quercetin dioxygenase-like cupin family protein